MLDQIHLRKREAIPYGRADMGFMNVGDLDALMLLNTDLDSTLSETSGDS